MKVGFSRALRCPALLCASQNFAMPFATAINDARSSAVGVCRVTGRESEAPLLAPRSRKCPSTALLLRVFSVRVST